jgi:hypothetical protein
MRKRIEKSDPEWELFKDIYKLYENYRVPESKDEYWESLREEANEIDKKYPENILSKKLIMAVLNALEEMSKENKQ